MLDASVCVAAVLVDGTTRRLLDDEPAAVPCITDAEIVNALRGQVLRGVLSARDAHLAIRRWVRLGIDHYPTHGLLDRVWELRDNLTAYDAAYVALAETLGAVLHTADARLAAAPGPRCPIVVLSS